jgi:hypothetical protein
MCMQKTDFSLKSDGKGGYYGVGYKSMHLANSKSKTPRGMRLGRWSKDDNVCTVGSNDGKHYEVGYHIFLDRKAAENYREGDDQTGVFEVHFRTVVAFGTNTDYSGSSYTPVYPPCIIAREIKPVKRVL